MYSAANTKHQEKAQKFWETNAVAPSQFPKIKVIMKKEAPSGGWFGSLAKPSPPLFHHQFAKV